MKSVGWTSQKTNSLSFFSLLNQTLNYHTWYLFCVKLSIKTAVLIDDYSWMTIRSPQLFIKNHSLTQIVIHFWPSISLQFM